MVAVSPAGPVPRALADAGPSEISASVDASLTDSALRDYSDRVAAALLGHGASAASGVTTADSPSGDTVAAVAKSTALATAIGGETHAAYAEAGATIISATVTPKVTNFHANPDGTVNALVTLTTDLQDTDASTPTSTDSGFAEDYELVLSRTVGGYVVTGSTDVTASEYSDGEEPDTSGGATDDSVDSDQSPMSDVYQVNSGNNQVVVVTDPPSSSGGTGSAGGPTSTCRTCVGLEPVSPKATSSSLMSSMVVSPDAGGAVTFGYPKETHIDAGKFAKYAKYWVSGPYNGDAVFDFNGRYPVFNNNCANFASQVLANSGWYMTPANWLNHNSSRVWTDNADGHSDGRVTNTWANAAALNKFAWNTGTYQRVPHTKDTKPGTHLC